MGPMFFISTWSLGLQSNVLWARVEENMTSSVGYWLYCAIPPVHLIHPSIARATGWLLLIWAQQHQQQHSLVQYRSNGMDGGFGVCLFAHLILFYTCCSSLHNNKPPPRSTHKFTPRCDLDELRDMVEYVCGLYVKQPAVALVWSVLYLNFVWRIWSMGLLLLLLANVCLDCAWSSFYTVLGISS